MAGRLPHDRRNLTGPGVKTVGLAPKIKCRKRGEMYRAQCVECWHYQGGDGTAKTQAQCRQRNEEK
jgi:hypothetical protein